MYVYIIGGNDWMKRLILLVAGTILLGACSGQQSNSNGTTYEFFPEDIILKNKEHIDNIERFIAFYKNAENDKRDQVRIVQQTIEGAPIYYDVVYADDKFELTIDSTKDAYAAEDLLKTTCKALNAVEVEHRTDYLLNECKGEEGYIILSDY